MDVDTFRTEKGGDPEKVRENQKKRFADPSLVDSVVKSDALWRKGISFFGLHLCRDGFLVLHG